MLVDGPAGPEVAAAVEGRLAPDSDVAAAASDNDVANAPHPPVSTPATATHAPVPSLAQPEDSIAPSTPRIVFTRASLDEADALWPATVAAEESVTEALVEVEADAPSGPSAEETSTLQAAGLESTIAAAEEVTLGGASDVDAATGALPPSSFDAPAVVVAGEDPADVEADEVRGARLRQTGPLCVD